MESRTIACKRQMLAMSVIGSNSPLLVNSSVVPTASPQAKPIKQSLDLFIVATFLVTGPPSQSAYPFIP